MRLLNEPLMIRCTNAQAYVNDFAQAYHQAALTLATKKYTSFILYSGVYQFTRLPFGLKQFSRDDCY